VLELEPDPDDRAKILVTAEILGTIPVNHASVASIEQITLTSSKHLEISTGDPDAPLHDDGDRLRSAVGAGAFGLPDLDGVVARLERLLDGLNTLTGSDPEADPESVDLGEVLESLKLSLDEAGRTLAGISQVVEENRPGMRDVVDRLASLEVAASELLSSIDALVDENREPLHASAVNIEELTGEARRMIEDLGASLEQLTASLQSFGANADDLMEDQRPALEEVLANLQQTTRNLREFSRILAEQPESLVRGKSSQGRQQ
jgi:ABC-type transporter Mla subunit MlaD